MYGKVIAFSADLKAGYLVGQNGRHYTFIESEWFAPHPPQTELSVQFDLVNGTAVNIN
jgi:hypothetical protein